MDVLIQFILTIPLEKVAVVLFFIGYLNDPETKDVLKSVLLPLAREKKLSEREISIDPIAAEIAQFNSLLATAWHALTKKSLNEDDRIPLNCKLLMAVKNKKFSELREKITALIELCYKYNLAGYEGNNALTSIYSALLSVDNMADDVPLDDTFFFLKKLLAESKDDIHEKIKRANAVSDFYCSIYNRDFIDRINLLNELNRELNHIQILLKPFIAQDEQKSETIDEKIVPVYRVFLALQQCIFDTEKSVVARLEAFNNLLLEQKQKKEWINREEVIDFLPKDFFENLDLILETHHDLLLPLPVKTTWRSGLLDFASYAVTPAVQFFGMFGRTASASQPSTISVVAVKKSPSHTHEK